MGRPFVKKQVTSMTCNQLSSKSLHCIRLTIGFPRKVSAVYVLQLAFLKK